MTDWPNHSTMLTLDKTYKVSKSVSVFIKMLKIMLIVIHKSMTNTFMKWI